MGNNVLIDLTGKRFGRLTAIKRNGSSQNGNAMWLCLCSCGNYKTVDGRNLRKGLSKSCGCLAKELTSCKSKTHGMSNSRMYNIWRDMIARCYNPNNNRNVNYGAKGITVCDKWHVFENFLKDMGECPKDKSIDRININGNYEPSNCRWATDKQQANNKSNNHYIEYNGETLTLAQWSEKTGINYGTLKSRLNRQKWSVEKALTTK